MLVFLHLPEEFEVVRQRDCCLSSSDSPCTNSGNVYEWAKTCMYLLKPIFVPHKSPLATLII